MTVKSLNLLSQSHQLDPKPKKLYKKKGVVHGNYFFLADKSKGIEPGSFAIEITPDFYKRVREDFHLSQDFKDLKECKTFFDNVANKKGDQLSAFVDQLLAEGKNESKTIPRRPLPLLLIKQDYHEANVLGVRPPIRRIKKTSTFKNYPKVLLGIISLFRYRPVKSENTNAIYETLATDVAKAYGMPAQDQSLLMGRYRSGSLKLMTVANWDPSVHEFSAIGGSKKTKLFENYILATDDHDKPLKKNNLFISANNIRNLGECLVLFIILGDRDVFGSKVENKLLKENELFGIDFGKCFAEENPILATLKDDFSFTQPRFLGAKFKNLSICCDTPLSERMAGLYFAYKMLGPYAPFSAEERKKIEKGLDAYCKDMPGFKERYDRVEANSLMKLFEEYQDTFLGLARQEKDPKKKAEYERYVNEIKVAHSRVLVNARTVLTIFNNRLQLGPHEVELLDSLTKSCSETSPLSGNKQVVLNHLRITENPGVHWSLRKEGQDYILSADMEPKKANRIKADLRHYLQQVHLPFPNVNGNQLEIRLNPKQLQQWQVAFEEERVTRFKLTGEATPPQKYDTTPKLSSELSAKTYQQDQEFDRLIRDLKQLTQQRQAQPASEVKIQELLTTCQTLKVKLSQNPLTRYDSFLERTGREIEAIRDERKDRVNNPQARALKINAPRSTGPGVFKAVSVASSSSAMNAAQIFLDALPIELKRFLQEKLKKNRSGLSLEGFMKKLVKHLDNITQEGLQKFFEAYLKYDSHLDAGAIAEHLFRSYKRATEQLDPYVAEVVDDPYKSSHYLPSDEILLAAKHYIDQQGGGALQLDAKWEKPFLEAVVLNCRVLGVAVEAKFPLPFNEKDLVEKSKVLKQLFDTRLSVGLKTGMGGGR